MSMLGSKRRVVVTGLGAVTPAVEAGEADLGDPLSNADLDVTVTVGGVPAAAFFAGLAPGFTGLYQVNAILPRGVDAGDAVPVIVTAGGISSPAVTIPMR